mgnify:CR=1 FL=1
MMKFVRSAFQDADVFLYMVENGEKSLKDSNFFERLKKTNKPILLLINKIDKSNQEGVEKALNHWESQLPKAKIIPISAIEGFGVDKIMSEIIAMLPIGTPYFPADALTDKPERFFVWQKRSGGCGRGVYVEHTGELEVGGGRPIQCGEPEAERVHLGGAECVWFSGRESGWRD